MRGLEDAQVTAWGYLHSLIERLEGNCQVDARGLRVSYQYVTILEFSWLLTQRHGVLRLSWKRVRSDRVGYAIIEMTRASHYTESRNNTSPCTYNINVDKTVVWLG